jgi:pentatricopeptide repeat protein
MGFAWKGRSSADFSAFPLGTFLPHEQRLQSLSVSPSRKKDAFPSSAPFVPVMPSSGPHGNRENEGKFLFGTEANVDDFEEEQKEFTAEPGPLPREKKVWDRRPKHLQQHQITPGKTMFLRQFNTRLNSLAQKGSWKEVNELLDMVECGSLKLDKEPDTRTFTIAVKAYCRADRLDLAEDLVSRMETWGPVKRPNRFTFNTLLNGFVRKNKMKKAATLFAQMMESKNPSQRPDQVTYSTMIKGYAASGDMENAELHFDNLRQACETWSQSESPDGHHSDDESQGFNSGKPNHVTCNTMVKGYANIGAMEKAEALFDSMNSGREGLCYPDKVTFNTMIDGYAKNGNMDRAEELFRVMACHSDPSIRPNQVTFNTMIDGYTKCGAMDMAEKLFAVIDGVKDSSVQETCRMLKMRYSELDKDLRPSPVTYGAMINGYVKASRMDKAERLFEKIRVHKDPSCRPNQVTYTTMIGSYAKQGQMDKAEKLFSEMLHSKYAACKPNQVTYSILIDGYSKQGNMEAAERLLRNMTEAGKAEHGCSPNQVTYNTLIHGYAQLGDTKKAEDVFELMRRSRDSSCRPNAITYRTMIHMYRMLGKISEAQKYQDLLQNHQGR